MAATGTSALAAEIKPLYDADFYMASQMRVYFDQFCDLKMVMNGQRGSSYNFPILESLQPSAGVLDELSDVVAQQMRANEIVVTLQEYGGAVEVTKFAVATSYADVYKQAAYANGYQLAESFDLVVRAVAGQGSRQFFVGNRTARSQIDGRVVAADRVSAAFIERLALLARTSGMPLYEDGSVCAVVHPFVLYDLLQDSGVRLMAQYQHPEILFNGEMAYWGGVRFIAAQNAKVFYGAGAPPTSGALSTTLAQAANVGDTTLILTSAANAAVGKWLAIRDGQEPGNTWFDTNELFFVTGVSGNQVTGFALNPGPGDGGGLRYAHPSGTSVVDNACVFPIVLLGPNSILKVASDLTGPYGETVITGPFDRLGRFLTFGWYAIVGYARCRNSWLLRGEVGSSQA